MIFDSATLVPYVVQGFQQGFILAGVCWFFGYCLHYVVKLFSVLASDS